MIALIATWLGVPLWLVLGMLGVMLWQRHQFKQEPDVFEAKIRLASGASEDFKEKWPRISGYGRWVHDVLLVHAGLGLRTNTPVPVAALEGPLDASAADAARRLGDNPVVYRLTLDDGATFLMAVPAEAGAIAVGPFVKTAIGHQD